MKVKIKALKAAFPLTIPVFTGFTFLGMAYGYLMNSKGYGVGWTFLMSFAMLAGSAQYIAITFLTSVFNPVNAFIMTLVINARHLFYGISMLEKYKNVGRLKPYLIFGLCDETFSLLCSAKPPDGADINWFYFFITLLNHFYWVLGSVLGALLGAVVKFSTKGLDFVLTALFCVIFIDQWKSQKNHKSAVVGVLCTAVCLAIFGQDNFIIPSMIAIITVMTLLRKSIESDDLPKEEAECR